MNPLTLWKCSNKNIPKRQLFKKDSPKKKKKRLRNPFVAPCIHEAPQMQDTAFPIMQLIAFISPFPCMVNTHIIQTRHL